MKYNVNPVAGGGAPQNLSGLTFGSTSAPSGTT